jgi:heat shock protein HslJ
MKIMLICLVLLSATLISKAQLANTKWTGTMMVPDEAQVMLSFKKDSLYIIINDEPVESMTYSVKDSLITGNKVDGKSPCNNDTFTLKYTIKEDKLFIKDIADPCDPRLHAWVNDPFTKQK